jgi:hypothetical protein
MLQKDERKDHDITDILLKVVLNIINHKPDSSVFMKFLWLPSKYCLYFYLIDDGSVIISLCNFVGEGIIKYTLMIHKYFHCIKFKKQNQIKIETIFTR